MTPTLRSDRVVLEANLEYWNPERFPRLQRIIYDNTLSPKEALELIKHTEGRVDLLTGLSPLETLRVAESPFAKVVKDRGFLVTVSGLFNIRKAGSPWRDLRVRQAVNVAINRDDLIQYAVKGNGIIVPALLPPTSFGYNPDLKPYAFDPGTARALLRDAGYPDGLAVTLIAPSTMKERAMVVSKMLEQVGLTVHLTLLDSTVFLQKTELAQLDRPADEQTWDIALVATGDILNFPVYYPYYHFALDGPVDWVDEEPELHQLYEQVLGTIDRDKQQAFLRQIERHTQEHAYFLFLYSPIGLYAVNKAVQFVPHVTGILNLGETSVMDEHWSVRKQKAPGPE
jgi:peptide/nickel transport system substrate-binding protein